MIIRKIVHAERVEYNVLAQRYGTLFNSLDWLELFSDNIETLGIFEDAGEMIGGFSLYQERRFGLMVLRSVPFTPTCGPFLSIKAKNPVAILDTYRKTLECVVKYLEKKSAAVVMLSLDRRIMDALPFYWKGYKVIPRYTYLLDLSFPVEQLRKNMSPIRRNDISKAIRDGLTVRATTDMGIVQKLVLSTFERQDKQINHTFLEAVLFRYSNSKNSFAFTAYRGETPISTCFIVHDRQTAYYLLGGYLSLERHHGAGPLAVFEAIQHSKEIGLNIFDFEGSMIPAIERYFRGFGGQLTPYYTVNKAWLPLEMGLKLLKRAVF